MDEMGEIVKEFLVESSEGLDQLDRDLVALEKDPEEKERLASIFRAIHTVKGTSGVLGFPKIESVAHVGENLLSRMRDGKLRLDPEITSGLLAMVDALRELLGNIEANGAEGEGDFQPIVDRLSGLLEARPTVAEISKPKARRKRAPKEAPVVVAEAPVVSPLPAVAEPLPEPPGSTEPAASSDSVESKAQPVSANNIRVDVGLLDKMMTLVGELVLARNQILQHSGAQQDSGLVSTAQRLNLITTELQESVMKTRMQPIGNIWNKLPRVVRDLSLACGKKVRVEMDGAETELDKTIIEAIKDPLTHIVRNAVDHGIEMPEVRLQAGKPDEGRLLLRAYHEGGQVNIEISDDGGGISLEAVREKARQRNVVSAEQAARMSERELLNLIFLPGFSTARQVTNISGRGVGMDVVKTNIEKIGGTVDLQSAEGKGTTLKIKIPLTLAIIPALIATSGGERFAIPQVSLLELVRLEGEAMTKGIEYIHGAPVYRLRGNLLPLVSLNQVFGLKSGGSAQLSAGAKQASNFDFERVKNKHLAWNHRISRMLRGELTVSVEEAGSHESCELGKWLYGFALENYSQIEEIRSVERLHRKFHASVRELVIQRLEGKEAAGTEMQAEIQRQSQELVGLLSTVQKEAQASREVNIVVLQADERQFGLMVDEINDTEEIVVKPLSKLLKGLSCFAGATIMGDGAVALILDVMGLAQEASVVSALRDHAVKHLHAHLDELRGNGAAWLLVRVGESGRVAIPLSSVDRLEEFASTTVERSAGIEVVQYREEIMPLVRLGDLLSLMPSEQSEVLPVVVSSKEGRSVGLVVDQIEDVTEQEIRVNRSVQRSYLQGSAVLQQKVTDLLDVDAVLGSVCQEYAEAIHA